MLLDQLEEVYARRSVQHGTGVLTSICSWTVDSCDGKQSYLPAVSRRIVLQCLISLWVAAQSGKCKALRFVEGRNMMAIPDITRTTCNGRKAMPEPRPNGVLELHEADFGWESELLQEVLRLSHCENTLKEGSYEEMLQKTGFKDITVEDLTDNVLPLWRLFGFLGAISYDILRLSGLHTRFTNIMAGMEAYRHWGQGRYISVRAVKP
jgi:hypothetical protein